MLFRSWGIFQFSKLTRFDFRVPGIHSSIVPNGSGFAINYSCHADNSKKLVFRLFSFSFSWPSDFQRKKHQLVVALPGGVRQGYNCDSGRSGERPTNYSAELRQK